MRPIRPALPAVAFLAFAGCSGGTEPQDDVDFEVIEEVTFHPSLGIDLSTMEVKSGIYYTDLVEGTGTLLTPGMLVLKKYKMWLANGRLVEDTDIRYVTGNFEVLLGFETGSLGMKVGGIRRLIVPPILGYAEAGSPSLGVHPGAVLIFEVELVAAQLAE